MKIFAAKANNQTANAKPMRNARRKVFEKRQKSDRAFRENIGGFIQGERTRIQDLWQNHVEFFRGEETTQETNEPVELVVNKDDIDDTESFFEA